MFLNAAQILHPSYNVLNLVVVYLKNAFFFVILFITENHRMHTNNNIIIFVVGKVNHA